MFFVTSVCGSLAYELQEGLTAEEIAKKEPDKSQPMQVISKTKRTSAIWRYLLNTVNIC